MSAQHQRTSSTIVVEPFLVMPRRRREGHQRPGLGERGQSLVESVLVLALIALLVLVMVTVVGRRTQTALCGVSAGLATIGVTNADFEQGTAGQTPPGWTSSGVVAPVVSTAQAHGGAQSMAVPVTPGAYGSVMGPTIPICDGGGTWDFSGWYRADAPATGMFYRINFIDASGTTTCCAYVLANATASTTWQRAGGRVTAPASATTMRIELFGFIPGVSTTEYWDDVTVASAVGVYNGDFEFSPSGQVPMGWSPTSIAGTIAPVASGAQSHTGAQSMATAVTHTQFGYADSQPIAVKSASTWNLSGWYRADVAAAGFYYRVNVYASGGALLLSTDLLANATASTSWQPVSRSLTLPAGANTMVVELIVWDPGVGVSTTDYWDSITASPA